MEEDFISLTEPTTVQDPISLEDKVGPPLLLSPEAQQQRAAMAHYALQDRSPGVPAIVQAIQEGREAALRQKAALDQDIKNRAFQLEMVSKVAGRKGGPLTPEEEARVMQLLDQGPTNPDTVLETLWADNYTKELLTHPKNKVIQTAIATEPEKTLATAGHLNNLAAKRQFMLSLKQEYQKQYESLPLLSSEAPGFGKVGSWIQSLTPFLSQYRLHDALEGSKTITESWLPGNNVSEQVDFAYLLPPNQFSTAIRALVADLWLKNPHDAMYFIDAMIQRGSSDEFLENAFFVLDVATIFPGSLFARGARAAADATNKVLDKTLPATFTKQQAEAVQDIVLSKKEVDAIKKGQEIQIGNAQESYKVRLIEKISDERSNELTKIITEGNAKIDDLNRLISSGSLSDDVKKVYRDELKVVSQQVAEAKQEMALGIARKPTGEFSGLEGVDILGLTNPSLRASVGDIDTPWGPGAIGRPKSFVAGKATYQVGDGITERSGQVSSRTVYLDEAEFNKFAIDGDKRIAFNAQGELVYVVKQQGKWQPIRQGTKVAYHNQPSEGRIPLELNNRSNLFGGNVVYNKYRFGGKITSVERETGNIQGDLAARFGVALPTSVLEDNVRFLMASGMKALKETPTASGSGRVDIQGALSTLGRIDEAADVGASALIKQAIQQLDPLSESELIAKNIPSLFHPNAYYENTSSLSRERASRLAAAAEKTSLTLMKSLSEGLRVPYKTEEEIRAAIDITKKQIEEQFRHINHSIIDIKYVDIYNPADNLHTVNTIIGKPNGLGFTTPESANNTALMELKLTPGSFYIKQEGQSFYINYPKHVRYDDPTLKDLAIPTKNQTPRSVWTMVFQGLRSAEDTTSELQRGARHIATHAPQELKKVILDVVSQIRTTLTKSERRNLEKILAQNTTEMNPRTNQMGRFYESAAEFEQAYLKRFGHLPSENLIAAYDTMVRLNDFDGMMRVLSWHSTKARWGAENISIQVPVVGEGVLKASSWFEGRKVKEFDMSLPRDQGIYIIDSETRTGKFFWKNDYRNDAELKKAIDEKIRQGYEIFQLLDPLKKPLAKDLNDSREIYYVMSNTAQTKRLQWGDNVDWRPGGHVVYMHPHFLKQPIIGRDGKGQLIYYGDHTFRSGGSSEAEARKWAEKYETARKLLVAGDDNALAAYLGANLPEDIDSFKKLFQGPNALNKDVPIYYAYHGQDVFQTNPHLLDLPEYRELKDWATDMAAGNPAAQLNKKFLSERADIQLLTPREKGSVNNPQYVLEKAPLIDPYTTLNTALGQAIRSRYMDDYKQLAAESFVREFGKYIHGVSPEKLERAPLYYLYNSKPDVSVSGAERAAFLANQRNVQNFVGLQSEIGSNISYLERKLQDSVYRRLGDEKGTALLESSALQNYLLPAIKDPTTFMRSVAFHSKLGFFNPIQLFVQSQALAHVLGVAGPLEAWRGFTGAAIAKYGLQHTDDPAILNKYAEIASKWGWTKEDYLEAVEAWKQSGVHRVAGETAWRDDFFDPRFFQGTAGSWLDKGAVFFATGERLVRDVAYFTAFHEWKKANPRRQFDQFAAGEVLNRFDTLSVNMTRASNSALQQGAASIPTQFLTFNQRLMEQFLGKRLTKTEKLRLFATYSALYGIPVGVSTPLGFYSLYDDVRAEALKRNINVNDNYYKLMQDGITGIVSETVFGRETNASKRLGPGGGSIGNDIKNLIQGDGDKTITDLIFGPSGQVIGDIISSTLSPFYNYAKSRLNDEQFNIMPEDFMQMFQEITTINNASKLWYAYNVGKYMTKRGVYVGDVTTYEAFLMATVGLTPQEFEDAFRWRATFRDERRLQNEVGFIMEKEFRKAIEAGARGETDKMNSHLDRARALGVGAGMNPLQIGRTLGKSGRGFESLIDQINQQILERKFRNPNTSIDDISKGLVEK